MSEKGFYKETSGENPRVIGALTLTESCLCFFSRVLIFPGVFYFSVAGDIFAFGYV